VNVAGAAGAALFAQASPQFYLRTHSLIGGVFLVEQAWVVIAFLVRRPPSAVALDPRSWLLAFGGTFAACCSGLPPRTRTGGLRLGLASSWLALPSASCRSSPWDARTASWLPTGPGDLGPYAVVRHPVYASYLMIQSGYVLQSISPRNFLVMVLASGCNVGRALMEERLLTGSPPYGPTGAGFAGGSSPDPGSG
jgi:hypothetical protein